MDPVKSLLFQHKSNPSVKLASASRRQPSRKVSKTCADDSIKSTTTKTPQAVKFVRFSKKIRTRKPASRKDPTKAPQAAKFDRFSKKIRTRKTASHKDRALEEVDASFLSREGHQRKLRQLRQCQKEVKKIDRNVVGGALKAAQ
jgi:hypothetical protein